MSDHDEWLQRLNGCILFGAARLGRKILRELRAAGVHPLAFADNDEPKQAQNIDGLLVYKPAAVRGRVVVITSMSVKEIAAQCEASGAATVYPHYALSTGWPEKFPNPFHPGDDCDRQKAAAHEIETARGILADEKSRELFERLLRFRRTLAVSDLPDAEPDEYFPRDIITLGDECFVDCGAGTGRVLGKLIRRSPARNVFYYGFEPDRTSVRKLLNAPCRAGDTCKIKMCVVADKDRLYPFCEMENECSHVGDSAFQVSGGRIDSVPFIERPTFIKMDVEGYELHALKGAEETIRHCAPKLAICAYHRPSHLWEIPLAIHRLRPDYKIYLRHHEPEIYGTVCYAVKG